ncbi:MAG: hypothetical protein CVU00_08565 [Bacteroidetes bacterium HGW-Bacteroidetes-17]|nr:MAG: hypothetical protein CVU00_08565 [Bacteroidetes bacterium HGW-Bacteroidetes-17]
MISCLILATSFAFSGGIVTNYNQSAAYIRMFARDATTEIDAVFYNPAGLTKLRDGWHFSFSGQNLTQTRTVNSTFPYLNGADFEGEAKVPIFPSFYTAYKKGKFAFSFGFNPVGGGGTATYNSGLPTMEIPFSTLVPKLAALGVTGYSANMMFKGYSVNFGFQGGVSYEINENISVFGGLRYVMASTTYEGYVKDVKVTTAAGPVRADDFMNGVAAQATAGATLATNASIGMNPLVANFGTLTFAQVEEAGYIDPVTRATLEGGLLQFGFTQAQIDGMSMTIAQASYNGAAQNLTSQATQLTASAVLMADQVADVKQTGSGVTPILGANLSFLENNLNIGIKYEFQTNIEVTNETAAGKGFTIGLTETGAKIEMFPNGAKTNADMPALLSIGFEYKLSDPLKFSAGYHTYFDGKAGWAGTGNTSKIDKNSIELAAGLEYKISDKLLISGGYLRTSTGANALYMSDITHTMSSNSGSIGGAYNVSDALRINFGIAYTKYVTATYDKTYNLSGTNVSYKESYGRDNLTIAIGIDFSVFK